MSRCVMRATSHVHNRLLPGTPTPSPPNNISFYGSRKHASHVPPSTLLIWMRLICILQWNLCLQWNCCRDLKLWTFWHNLLGDGYRCGCLTSLLHTIGRNKDFCEEFLPGTFFQMSIPIDSQYFISCGSPSHFVNDLCELVETKLPFSKEINF